MNCDKCSTSIRVPDHYIERSGANLCEECFQELALDNLGGELIQYLGEDERREE